MPQCPRARRPAPGRGFTMIEAVISLLIIGTLLTAVLSAASGSRLAHFKIAQRARALGLAQQLIEHALPLAYAEYAGSSLGPGGDERKLGTRRAFDDVDDYAGWSASPPEDLDGQPMPGLDAWGRRAEVVWVDPDEPDREMSYETHAKRITVIIEHRGVEVLRLSALRTEAAAPLYSRD